MLVDTFRGWALRGWWPHAAVIAAALTGLSVITASFWRPPAAARSGPVLLAPQQRSAPMPDPHRNNKARPRPEPKRPGFEIYNDIYRAGRPTDDQVYVFTYSAPSDEEDIIGCVDADSGKWRWRRHAVAEGRYTLIDAGQTTLLEITGWPQENTLAVRRLSDGAVLGRPWKVGRIWLTAISGRRVTTIGEGPSTEESRRQPWRKGSPTVTAADLEHEVATACVYDEWGHLLRSFPVRDPENATGFRRGFAIVCRGRTIIIDDAGRTVHSLR
jgi:hypothetical protein